MTPKETLDRQEPAAGQRERAYPEQVHPFVAGRWPASAFVYVALWLLVLLLVAAIVATVSFRAAGAALPPALVIGALALRKPVFWVLLSPVAILLLIWGIILPLPPSRGPVQMSGPPAYWAVLKTHRVVLRPMNPNLEAFAAHEEVVVDITVDSSTLAARQRLTSDLNVTDVIVHYPEARISPNAKGWFLREIRFPRRATPGSSWQVSRVDDNRLPETATDVTIACSTTCPATEVQVQDLPTHTFYRAQNADRLAMLPYVRAETAQWSLSPIDGDQPITFAFVPPDLRLLRILPLPDVLVEVASWGDLVLALLVAGLSGFGGWSVLKLAASKAGEGGWLMRILSLSSGHTKDRSTAVHHDH